MHCGGQSKWQGGNRKYQQTKKTSMCREIAGHHAMNCCIFMYFMGAKINVVLE